MQANHACTSYELGMYERAEFANERLDVLKTAEFAFPLTFA